MKKILYLLLLPLIFSCGDNSPEGADAGNVLENLTFTVDTVVVDSGDDFLVLGYSLGSMMVSEDKSRLYFFQRNPLVLVEVHLNGLRVLRKTEFEAEGPDGVGSYLGSVALGPEEQIFISSYQVVGLFDKTGKKIKDLKFVPEGIKPDLAENHQAIFSGSEYDFGTGKLYAQPHFDSAGEYLLVVLDPETQTGKTLPIPRMKIVDDFSGIFETKSGTSTTFYYYGQRRFTSRNPSQLILSASTMSGLYTFDIPTERLEFVDIQHQTVPNVMNVTLNKTPTSEADVIENRRILDEHLNYQEVLWDDQRKMHFRFGLKTFKGEKQNDPTTYELYLFAYDKDFNVLGETRMENLKEMPRSAFFKDGKLWSYVNVNDELGFAVIDFMF